MERQRGGEGEGKGESGERRRTETEMHGKQGKEDIRRSGDAGCGGLDEEGSLLANARRDRAERQHNMAECNGLMPESLERIKGASWTGGLPLLNRQSVGVEEHGSVSKSTCSSLVNAPSGMATTQGHASHSAPPAALLPPGVHHAPVSGPDSMRVRGGEGVIAPLCCRPWSDLSVGRVLPRLSDMIDGPGASQAEMGHCVPAPPARGSQAGVAGSQPSAHNLLAVPLALPGCSSNADQLRAAKHDPHSALIIFAPAGAGKTLTLIQRVLHLLSVGLAPESVLCLTFTRKASRELSARLASASITAVEVRTFHAWCLRLIRTFQPQLGVSGLAAQSQMITFIGEAVRAWQLSQGADKENTGEGSGLRVSSASGRDAKTALCRRILRALGHVRLHGLEAAAPLLQGEFGAFILKHYTASLRSARLLDMGELQSIALQLLNDGSVLEKVRQIYSHILVDEFQDTNSQQMALLRAVRDGAANGSSSGRRIGITVVGDDDQSIYSFRGAEPGIFSAFRRHMPDCTIVTLSRNYRSSGHIVRAASALVSKNAERVTKQTWTANAEGERVVVCECANVACEIDWVVEQLVALRKHKTQFADVAILYRTHAIGRQLQSALREKRVPIRTTAAEVFARADIAPLIALMRLLVNHDDSASFQAVVRVCQPPFPTQLQAAIADDAARRGVSQLACARALHAATGPLPPDPEELAALRPMLDVVAVHVRGDGRAALHSLLSRIDELVHSARMLPAGELLDAMVASGLAGSFSSEVSPVGVRLLGYELTAAVDVLTRDDNASAHDGVCDRMAGLRAFVEHVALSDFEEAPDDGGKKRHDSDALTLSTIHGAKGLEWPVVFVIRCNEETIPLNVSTEGDELSTALIQEERRLLYVAMTRARAHLFLSYLVIGADKQPAAVSSFLQDIPAQHRHNVQHMCVENEQVRFVSTALQRVRPRPQLKPYAPNSSQPAHHLPDAVQEQLRFWHQERPKPQAASKRKAKHAALSGKTQPSVPKPVCARGTSRREADAAGSSQAAKPPTESFPRKRLLPSSQRRIVIPEDDEDDFE